MKEEREACKEAYKNIVDSIDRGILYIKDILSQLENVEDCWKFIRLKSLLMQGILDLLPIRGEDCPFCLLYFMGVSKGKECSDCPYGELHGRCVDLGKKYRKKEAIEKSTYQRLLRKILDLEYEIIEYGRTPEDEESA